MKITVPELVLIAGTRGMLGAGIGLLAAGRISDDHRRLVGKVLFAIGAATTIPLLLQVSRRAAGRGSEAVSMHGEPVF